MPTLPNRTFGIEIEAGGLRYSQAADAINSTGYSAIVDGYHHEVSDSWKIMEDGSVSATRAFEAVSPILRGEEGIQEARKVSRALNRAGATVHRTCGFHVHIDVSDLTPAELATVIHRYARFESKIDSFMPPSRRGDNNAWCQSIESWDRRLQSHGFRSRNDIIEGQIGRERKVNLQCFERQGTIEFRHHAGTLNPTKIENWVRFLLYFVETCRATGSTTVGVSSSRVLRRPAQTVVIPVDDNLFLGVPAVVEDFFTERAENLEAARREREAASNTRRLG